MLVGGTALAAWQVRAHSRDVDLYMPEISPDAVEIVEHEFRARHGESFRLDVTTGENVWGSILLRDIASSPLLGAIAGLELRALRLEDLFLLKLATGRQRDHADLDLLAPRTTVDALVDRWNQLVKWHGDRQAILGFADALVAQLQRLFACDPVALIARLQITASQRDRMARNGSWQTLAMISRAEVEQDIIHDESLLERVVNLLQARSGLADWRDDARTALALALEDSSMSRAETWKAVTLRRHLFGPAADVPEQLVVPGQLSIADRRRADRRRADRLRADLAACVHYRAGMHLLSRSR